MHKMFLSTYRRIGKQRLPISIKKIQEVNRPPFMAVPKSILQQGFVWDKIHNTISYAPSIKLLTTINLCSYRPLILLFHNFTISYLFLFHCLWYLKKRTKKSLSRFYYLYSKANFLLTNNNIYEK